MDAATDAAWEDQCRRFRCRLVRHGDADRTGTVPARGSDLDRRLVRLVRWRGQLKLRAGRGSQRHRGDADRGDGNRTLCIWPLSAQP